MSFNINAFCMIYFNKRQTNSGYDSSAKISKDVNVCIRLSPGSMRENGLTKAGKKDEALIPL